MKPKIQEYKKNSFKNGSLKLIAMALLMAGTTLVAQEKDKGPQHKQEQFTPEQKSQLQVKKMTLELDLNEAQQKDLSVLIADKMTKREAHKTEMKAMKEKGVRPTSDERFAMEMKMLDEQIAMKKSMQKILNAKQYDKWVDLQEKHKKENKKNQKEKHKAKHKGDRSENEKRRG